MIKNETRESAHLRSRVKDLSAVPNLVNFTGLFAAITPIAKLEKNPDTDCYEPILIRDVDSLIANFGDPRIDPEKYIDLYSIMQVVANGTSCYVAKVDSGDPGQYEIAFIPISNDEIIDAGEVQGDISRITNGEGFILDNIYGDYTFVASDSPDGDERTWYRLSIPDLYNQYSISDIMAYKCIDGDNATVTLQTKAGHSVTFEATDVGEKLNNFHIRVEGGPARAGEEVHVCLEYPYSSLEDHRIYKECYTDYSLSTLNRQISEIRCISEDKFTEADFDHEDNEEAPLYFVTLDSGTSQYSQIGEEILEDNRSVFYAYNEESANRTLVINFTASHPDKVIINTAKLDPDYGREEITLDHKGIETSADGTVFDVFESNALDRKYSIITVVDENNHNVEPSLYTVKWRLDGGKNVLKLLSKRVDGDPMIDLSVLYAARQKQSIMAYSTMPENISISCSLQQAKPYSLKLFYLVVEVRHGGNVLGTAKVKLEKTTTNQSLVNSLNSTLGTFIRFELVDKSTASAAEGNDLRDDSIVCSLLNKYAEYANGTRSNLESNPQPLAVPITLSEPNFKVTLKNYIDAQEQFKDRKYVGCMMADMAAPVTDRMEKLNPDDNNTYMVDGKAVLPLDYDERRSLHYYLKQIACERKDTTVILSTPLWKDHTSTDAFLSKDDACDWVASQGSYVDLWEYGQGATTDYATQSFYLEMYYSWLNQQCTKIENGLAKSVKVKTPPSNIVINNILTSWRERGVQYPVAGDQYGTLPETCAVLQNPKTKLDRDQFVQYRINPIWDTGTRGVQIYGNETLNAGYTDLNAAHIARTLVYIRGRIDEYTETLKFSLNNSLLWDKWKTYVTQYILEPLISVNALSEYRIAMGEDTTSPEERANRQVNGLVQLIFYQSAEIFDLTYTVYSSSTTIDEAMANT